MVREKCKVLLSQGSKCLKFWLLHFVKIHLAEPENDSERFSCAQEMLYPGIWQGHYGQRTVPKV